MSVPKLNLPAGRTFAHQDKLPKLPVPPLDDTCKRYLRALEALQDEREHAHTKEAVRDFLENDGPKIQEKLEKWAETKDSYIEDFWYESYLSHSDPVVLALNPFFVLENDPSPDRGAQLPRAASLIVSSLGFIHDLRAGLLHPDTVRGIPLDMDQYMRLFGSSRIPTEKGCRMDVKQDSQHIVVLRRGQFYWFDVLDENNLALMTEREVLRNLQAIVNDADKTPPTEVARSAIGILSTENRKVWGSLRTTLKSVDRHNELCLSIVDEALFVVCLDDTTSDTTGDLCSNYMCGTYKLAEGGEQVGTCTNRWYDKLQIIICADGSAGINFEHTGVDGHTVLRFAADIFTDGLMLLARSINPNAPTLFHSRLSPYARTFKPPRFKPSNAPLPAAPTRAIFTSLGSAAANFSNFEPVAIDTTPKKLDWHMSPALRVGVRFAETRLSALICQNECAALEFAGYGKAFVTSHGFSPDAFVQMAFQAAYFGLYGRIECVYEPAMTKSYLHGRTEAIRPVQPESVEFIKTYYSEATASQKVAALRKACERHVQLTKECAQGLGQDRHLYALYCLLRRELDANQSDSLEEGVAKLGVNEKAFTKMPKIFSDSGWLTLNTSIISTSNCGNPALRLFGFGPVAADGYGIGYIIKEDRLSFCASSKHLQTPRLLDTLKKYLLDIQRLLIQLHRSANERPAPFVDHLGVLRDSKTGRPINGYGINGYGSSDSEDGVEDSIGLPGYSFFDAGDVELLGHRKKLAHSEIGKVIPLSEY